MAIPKKLREIPKEKAERLIAKHLKNNTGWWEDTPGVSDFVYEIGDPESYNRMLIRPGFNGTYETGKVSL